MASESRETDRRRAAMAVALVGLGVACSGGTIGSSASSVSGGEGTTVGAGGSLASGSAGSGDGSQATGGGRGAGGFGGGGAAPTSGTGIDATSASSSAEGASSSVASSASASTGGGEPMDPCLGKMAACPGVPPTVAGKGLLPIDRCAFPIVDQATWTTNADLIAALATKLPTKDVAALLGDLNRTAVNVSAGSLPGSTPNVTSAFRWNDGDNNVAYWIPQGLTGSADANAMGLVAGHHVAIVSWYYEKSLEAGATYEKGVRLAVVDTSLSPPQYRLALLVEPVAGNPPSFQAIPIHAGGIAWFGDDLYVADTSKGFRVFDLAHVLAVDASKDMIGYDPATKSYGGAKYAYVVPQVGRYVHASMCAPKFSFVGLDRSEDPPSLVSGEYCNGTDACDAPFAGRLYRWPLDPATGRLGPATSFPSASFYMGEKQVQGGLFRSGTALLSSSAPAAGAGELYRIPPNQPRTKVGWIDAPEDLYQDLVKKQLWGLSEGAGARYVFAAKAP